MNSLIDAYAVGGKNDAIKCMFMYPSDLMVLSDALVEGDDPEVTSRVYQLVVGSDKTKTITKSFNIGFRYNNLSEEYEPKNNKLMCFPYRYLLVSNNNGGSAIYHFEQFKIGEDNTIKFRIDGCITPGGSIRMAPFDYKGMSYNYDEGLNLGKYPICNWASDEYTNWLTQNSVNIGLSIAAGAGQIVGGVGTAIATGGAGIAVGGGMAAGGVSAIASQLAQIHQMSFASPQSRGNINCGDAVAAMKSNTFFFNHMRIKNEYAKIIDDYFSMFGYRCNRVKIPNKNHRSRWWFTKTVDVNIAQINPIPQADVEKIKNCYNSGVTFWKNNIKNYALDNPII